MSTKRYGFSGDAGYWLRGVCMGAADIVPGVSGGTVALILGHYERLVTAISHVDRQFLRLLSQRKIRSALEYLDFRFLVGLGLGILSGILALASLMHYLLENQQSSTYAVFAGLILGSSYLIAKRLSPWTWSGCLWAVAGAYFAWQICVLQPMHGNLTPITAFLAATVAICAMILPGISGAFVLLLLGLYHPVTTLIKGLPRGEFSLQGLLIIACFGMGCLVGLLLFSRVLKWLLSHKHDATLSFLCGLMLGSLVKIWPFQQVTQSTADLEFKERQYELILPSSPAQAAWVLFLCGAAVAATLLLDKLGRRFAGPESPEDQVPDGVAASKIGQASDLPQNSVSAPLESRRDAGDVNRPLQSTMRRALLETKNGHGSQGEIHARYLYSCDIFGDLHEGVDCLRQPAGYLREINPMAGTAITHAITSFH